MFKKLGFKDTKCNNYENNWTKLKWEVVKTDLHEDGVTKIAFIKSDDKELLISFKGIKLIEPTTKVRNSVLLQLAENNSFSEQILRKECPKLFDNKLEVGKWYKGSADFTSLIYITKLTNKAHYNEIFYYGFTFGDYRKSIICNVDHEKSLVLATPQEVETALINEAKKRGYKKGVEVVDIYNGKTEKDTTIISSNRFEYEVIMAGSNQGDMALRDSDGNIIFHNGKWAEIIETPSDIITIVEKYGKDELQKYLDNYKK